MDSYEQKKMQLNKQLRSVQNPVCLFSGGVDSALLAFLCHQQNPAAHIVFVEMTTLSKDDIAFARNSAKEMRIPLEIIPFDSLIEAEIANNTENRCYYCKRGLLTQIKKHYPASTVLDGSNADDQNEFRPGKKALQEQNILSPLANAGFTKQDIRRYAAELKLPAANRRSKPCLLTRFPYHICGGINLEMLRKIEKGERLLESVFADNFRLRWVSSRICRIEATKADCSRWEHYKVPADFPFPEIRLQPTENCSGSFDRISPSEDI